MNQETDFRPLSDMEKGLLEKLLGLNFHGRAEIAQQLPGLLARKIEESGTLEFKPTSGPAAPHNGCVAEARFKDRDDAAANVLLLLHVKNGKLSLLEIYKEDGSAILRSPDPDKLTDLFTPCPRP